MDRIVRVGAVAREDPEPGAELDAWRADLDVGRIDDPEETRRRLEAYERGEQMLVRLELFAEVVRGGGIERFDGTHVTGSWFEPGAGAQNLAHGREMVASNLERFQRELTEGHGLQISYDELLEAPVSIEVAPELSARLSQR
jgi:hypothetical protein